jgi:hypothetical protein
MSNKPIPWAGVMPAIDQAISLGVGAAASVVGQPYNVYRLSNASSGSIFDGSPLFTNFSMSVSKAGKSAIENDSFNLQVFIGACDDRELDLGDVLVEQNYESETGDVFVFAQRRPMGYRLFVRCEAQVSITRPLPHGGQSAQQPVSGSVAAPGYIGVDKASENVLVLNDGLYSFEPTGTLAAVPAGLTQLNRIRDAKDPKIPVTLYREHFVLYVPLLPGVQLQELDRFNFPNSDRYQIASLYTTEQSGFGGWIAICEKLGT